MTLSLLIIIPVLGAIIVATIPRERVFATKVLAMTTSLLALAVSLPLYFRFDSSQVGYQFEEIYPWIPAFNVYYHVGIDGISLFLVILTTFLTAVAVLSSWTAITEQVKEYYALLLLLQAAVVGVFISLDLFLFFLFWEGSLIPMALLIGRWGGKRRVYAATKFLIYTMAGSALMLVAVIVVYVWGGTADIPVLVATLELPETFQIWLFFAFALAFAVKVPVFPLHTWLPAAHVEAPTAGSIILAGVLLKLGTVWIFAVSDPVVPWRGSVLDTPDGYAGYHRYHLWCHGGFGTGRCKEPGGLFFCGAYGVHCTGDF
jgi:NADH-quinone oxidoreductase subunit M